MDNLNNYTTTEILQLINNIIKKHDQLKESVLNKLSDLEKIETKINEDITNINNIIKLHSELLLEYNKRIKNGR